MGAYISKIYAYFTVPSTNLLTWPKDVKEDVRNPKSKLLCESIKGNTIHVPNVEAYFEGWPMNEINTCYLQLKPRVDAKIAT
jgi:hypothetical protein